MMAAGDRKYSCESAAETREWMNAIADFLRPFKPLVDAHVVNFFKVVFFFPLEALSLVWFSRVFSSLDLGFQGRLWELVDEQWMACLRKESVENLLNLPSGVIQVVSLVNFLLKNGCNYAGI